jgi:hypothetical protein
MALCHTKTLCAGSECDGASDIIARDFVVMEQVASRHDLSCLILASNRDVLPSLLPRFLRKSVYLLKVINENALELRAQPAEVQARSIIRDSRFVSCFIFSFMGMIILQWLSLPLSQ